MFWKYAPLISQIDTLMEKEDVSLTAVLDEDDVLQECRAQNAKLVSFLTIPEHLHSLVKYVTDDPPSEADDATKYKYPNIACELLTCDVTEINDALIKDTALLDLLYSFLKTEEPLNPLTASFYVKVMGMLTYKKSDQMFDYIKGKEDFLQLALYHIGTSAIVDLLVRLLRDPQPDEMKNKYVEWITDQGFVRRLLAGMKPSNDSDKHYHTSQCVCEIITMCRESLSQCQENADISILLDSLESSSTVSDLLTFMFEDENPKESVLVNGLRIILMLFDKKKSETHAGVVDPSNLSAIMNENDLVRLAQAASNAIEAVLPKLSHFSRLLQNPPKQHYSPMPTSSGTLNPPLGATRLCIVSLIDALLSVGAPVANFAVHEYALLDIILDLFIVYPLNSFLHHSMTSIITTILTSGNPQEESINKLQHQLLVDCRLLERLLNTYENTRGTNRKEESADNGVGDAVRCQHDGHIAHVLKIAKIFNDNITEGETHKEHLSELFNNLDEKTKNDWNVFIRGPLAESLENSRIDPITNEENTLDHSDIPNRLGQEEMGFLEDDLEPWQYNKFESIFSNKVNDYNFDTREQREESDVWVLSEDILRSRKDELSVGRDTRLAGLSGEFNEDEPEREEEDSSSEEEDLDSPIVIRQKPRKQPEPTSSSQEAMDVDESDEWAVFDNRSPNCVKTTAENDTVNMDTTQTATLDSFSTDKAWSPFETASEPVKDDSAWASFEAPKSSEKSEDGWADFASPEPAASGGSEGWADFQQFPDDADTGGDSEEKCAGKKRTTRDFTEEASEPSSPDQSNGPV